MITASRRVAAAVLLAIVAAMAFATVTPATAGAVDAGPSGDNRHWARSTGSETVVYVDDNGGPLRPLVDNSAQAYSKASSLLVVPVADCPAQRNCIYLFPEAHGCGGSVAHGNMSVFQGHVHIGAALVGIDVSGCNLQLAQYVTCNTMGRALGLAPNGFAPCGEGDLMFPTNQELLTVQLLHAHVHYGTWYPTGV